MEFTTNNNITMLFLIFFLSGFAIKNKHFLINLFEIIHDFACINMITNAFDDEEVETEKKTEVVPPITIPPIKYEDKYLDQIHEMNPDYDFTEEELYAEEEEFQCEKKNREKKRVELEKKIDLIEIKIINVTEKEEEEYKQELLEEVQNLKKECENLILDNDEIIKEIRQKTIQKHIENLKNCFIIEKTPLGNVAMYYNSKRGSFEYFSDNTIPYRFLEVIGRKYVVSFHCRPLYIIMEEELKKYEEKLEQQKKLEQKKLEQQNEQNQQTNSTTVPKKNVFAKFKSYNKEAGSGRVNKAPPPKNSIPQKTKMETGNEKIILKENANRYTYEGRFSNFNPLQKIQRKQIDKKYAMNYAEFKKKLITTKQHN
jgi:hypothetical protein